MTAPIYRFEKERAVIDRPYRRRDPVCGQALCYPVAWPAFDTVATTLHLTSAGILLCCRDFDTEMKMVKHGNGTNLRSPSPTDRSNRRSACRFAGAAIRCHEGNWTVQEVR